MRAHSLCRGFFFLFLTQLVLGSSNGDDKTTLEVVGIVDCADCKEHNFKPDQAFSGLRVTIDCKREAGEIKRVGAGELDQLGKFKVQLPQHIVQQDGQKLKHDCYVQLHSGASIPCETHGGLEASRIVFKSKNEDRSTFSPTKPLRFSTAFCSSKSFWPYYNFPWTLPPLPPLPPLYNPKPLPPPVPIYKPKLKPPPVPTYKPKPPKKPVPPPVPTIKPKPPVNKPPFVKPLPPPIPFYKPMPPPIPIFPFPPLYKKPCPPLPKLPPLPFIPPNFGHFPPLFTPTIPIP